MNKIRKAGGIMSKKDLQIRNLSKNRYRELKYLCL